LLSKTLTISFTSCVCKTPTLTESRRPLGKAKLHKDVATLVKQGFDAKYPPVDNKASSGVYHCIVGTNFAVSVTHETHASCYWSCGNVKLLLYKSKDSPFD